MLIALALCSLVGIATADETEVVIVEQDDAILVVEVSQRAQSPRRSMSADTRWSRRRTAERSWRVPPVRPADAMGAAEHGAHAMGSWTEDELSTVARP